MKIAVVGFGITGVTLAILLSRSGYSVDLYEQSKVVGPVGAGILLQPSGQRVLEAMGLLESSIQNSEKINEIYVRTQTGRQLVKLIYNEWSQKLCAYGIHRGRLFEVLAKELYLTKCSIFLSKRICRHEDHGHASFLIDDKNEKFGPYDWIFACDGVNSSLLQNSGLITCEHQYKCGAFWHVGQSDNIRSRLFQATDGTRRLNGLLPTGNGECSFFWGATSNEAKEVRDNFDLWKQKALNIFPEGRQIIEGLKSADDLIFTTWRHRQLKTPLHGRLLFMGDAAYPSSPHLGQGVNLGLLDAWIFNDILQNCDSFAEAAKKYVVKRKTQRNFYSLITFLLSPFFQSTHNLFARPRDLSLPLLNSIPLFRKQMISVLTGQRAGWLGGEIKI